MYRKWNLWMIIPYTIFSSIICLIISLANKWRNSPSLWLKAHLVFLVLIITTVYSFFFDKLYEKPDVYSLVSSACFAIMSLCLSKLSNFGFEVDLVYFFCGHLILQFMTIKMVLIIPGAFFSYSLVMLHFYLAATTETGNLGTQSQDLHSVFVQGHDGLEKSNTAAAQNIHSQQESNTSARNTHPQEAIDLESDFDGVRKEKVL
jgi:hypothetical protein